MPRGRKKGCKASPKTERSVIQINDKYRVVLDKLNYTLQQYAPELKTESEEDKNNNDGWKFFGYFTDWNGVFGKILRSEVAKHIGKKKHMEVVELNEIFLEVKKEIKEMVKGLSE